MSFSIALEDPLLVPYLCGSCDECNKSNFMEYPGRRSFDVDKFMARGNTHTPEGLNLLAAFLQAWLFFGLMRTILGNSGISVQIDDFVCPLGDDEDDEDETLHGIDDGDDPEEQSLWVDITNLALYALYWTAKESHIDDDARKERLWAENAAVFSQANTVVNKLIAWRREYYKLENNGDSEPHILDTVILSIVLLNESLFDNCKRLFNDRVWNIEWQLGNALRGRLLRAGWCPGEIAVLQNKIIHSSSLYIIGGFDRHCLTKDHTRCSDNICVANHIDKATYKTKHAFADCSCAHHGEETETSTLIANILRSGSIPVIQVVAGAASNNDFVISVQESNRMPYVAISHVWSDGLGNPNNNTLPQCQLRRLQHYVDSLYPESARPIPLWVDTICVPRQADLRRTAIWRMAQTYKSADKVLVIDDWLTQTGFYGNPDLDLLKVKSCTWTERLWTLHESVLTRSSQLYFQTPEGPLAEEEIIGTYRAVHEGVRFMAELIASDSDSLQELYPGEANAMIRAVERIDEIRTKALEHGPQWNYADADSDFPWWQDYNMLNLVDSWYAHNFVWVEGRDHFLEMRWPGGHQQNDNPTLEANSILIIGECMRFRSTSWIEDEPICFATLLGQDPKELLGETTVEDRMKIVVSKMRHVPTQIIFSPRPRINAPGLRWAPLSFRATTVGKGYSPGVAFTTVAQIQPEGLLLKLDGILLSLEDRSKVGSKFQVRCGSALLLATMNGQITYAGGGNTGKALALLVRDISTLPSRIREEAVLVELLRNEADILFTTLLAHYLVGPSVEEETEPLQVISGRSLQKQQWCVG